MNNRSSINSTIIQLIDDVRPVERLSPWYIRTLRWITLSSIIATLIALSLANWRPDLSSALCNLHFLTETSLLIFCVFLSVAVGLQMSIPGGIKDSMGGLVCLFILLSAWMLLLALRGIFGDNTGSELSMTATIQCATFTSMLGILPSIFLAFMLRRGASTSLRLTSTFIALGGFLLGSLFMQFICPLDKGAHTLFAHAMPVFIVSCFSFIVGRKILRW